MNKYFFLLSVYLPSNSRDVSLNLIKHCSVKMIKYALMPNNGVVQICTICNQNIGTCSFIIWADMTEALIFNIFVCW